MKPEPIICTARFPRTLVALWIVAVVLLVVKSPDALSRPQFWAEDGAVFFADQFRHDWPLVFKPYAGYLHLMPRLVAWIGSCMPIERQPLIYNAAAIAIDAFCIAYVASRARYAGRMVTVLLAFYVVPTIGDIFGTMTNVQWFLQFALLVACTRFGDTPVRRGLWEPGRRLLLLSAALTGPFAMLWVMILGLQTLAMACLARSQSSSAHTAGGRYASVEQFVRWDRFVVLCVGAVIQALVLANPEVGSSAPTFMLSPDQWTRFAAEPSISYWRIVNHPLGSLHLIFLTFYVAAAIVAMRWWHQVRDRPRLWLLTLMALGCLEPVLAFAKVSGMYLPDSPSRYYYLWGVTSVWVVASFAEARFAWSSRIGAVVLASVFVVGLSIRPDYFRRGSLTDLDWRGYAQAIEHESAPHVVPLNPLPWGMVLR